MKEYLIFRVKIDDPLSFEYIAEAQDYKSARDKAKELKQEGYAIGINEITRFEA
jgi:hypothetical protein